MLVFALILFAVSAAAFLIGLALLRGKTELIHEYHQKNVTDRDRRRYAKAYAAAFFVMAGALLAAGAAALFNGEHVLAVSLGLLFAGLAAGLALLIRAQIRFNGGIF